MWFTLLVVYFVCFFYVLSSVRFLHVNICELLSQAIIQVILSRFENIEELLQRILDIKSTRLKLLF